MKPLYLLALVLPFLACSADSGNEPPVERSAIEAQIAGSCQPAECGGRSQSGCWCDSECEGYGDCCGDKVAVCDAPQTGIESEAQFEQLLQDFQADIADLSVTLLGKALVTTGDWEKDWTPTSAGATSYRLPGGILGVFITGWVARWPDFGPDEFELVLCHEMGHLVHSPGKEHDADYYATSQCVKHLWAGEDHLESLAQDIDTILSAEQIQLCEENDPTGLCLRTMVAAIRVNSLRAWAWRDFDWVEQELACRVNILLSGIFDLPMYECEEREFTSQTDFRY